VITPVESGKVGLHSSQTFCYGMTVKRIIIFCLSILALAVWASKPITQEYKTKKTKPTDALDPSTSAAEPRPLDELRDDFVKLKFGMFIHFNMGTYHEIEWVAPGKDPASFKRLADQVIAVIKSALHKRNTIN
jgi:hypothetical protein